MLLLPLVSVVIPTYNRKYILSELIEALSRQTFRDFEVIIVNDCGEPVDEVVAAYPELDIRQIDLTCNQQHVRARNEALAHAGGGYILLCDDDDLILPGHIERMTREIEGYDLVYSDVEMFDYTIIGCKRYPANRTLFAYDHDLAAMRRFSTFVASGCLYRRKLHEQLGLFDPQIHHYWDWDFYLRAAGQFKVKRVPVASTLYAFSNRGTHQSAAMTSGRKHYLELLSAKHNLGDLPIKNFWTLLEEPEIKARASASERIWDGKPIHSRIQD